MTHRYQVHGLVIESEMELPDLALAPTALTVDVMVSVGTPTERPAPQDIHIGSDFASFDIPGVAGYEIEAGQRIHVAPDAGADLREVRIFLLGSAMGLLLHQRGSFALHAAAGVFGDRAVAFTGPSGAGKSTVALAMQSRGIAPMSDDLVVIEPRIGGVMIRRAVRRMRLCADALEERGLVPTAYDLSYAPGNERTKYDVPFLDAPETVELGAIVELAVGDDALVRLEGLDAVDCLMANSFRGELISPGRQRTDHFKTCVAIAETVPVYRLSRPRDLAMLDRQLDRIAALAELTA